MTITDIISINITGHGVFKVEANDFDRMISRHIPASPYGLRRMINERSDYPPGHYDDVHTVTELLMILAEYEGFGR